MPTYQYPSSLVAQFTEEIYKNAGASDVLPLVMKSLDAEKVLGVQFLRGGKVRLTFEDAETCSAVLKGGLDLGDVPVQLFPADDRVRIVHLRDLPVEVDHDSVSAFFATYGEVLSIDHCHFEEYPTVRNGNRVIKILLTQDSPCFVEVEGCSCRVWYFRQPAKCSICREIGHRAPACPLSGRCRRCHQPGHVAREFTQAWGPLFPVSRSTDPSMETDEVPATTASVIVPVNTTSIADVTVSTAVITTAATVSTVPATVPSTSVNSIAAPVVSTSFSTVTATAAATDSACSVSTVASVPSTSDASSASVSKSKSPRPVISAKSFRTHLEKN